MEPEETAGRVPPDTVERIERLHDIACEASAHLARTVAAHHDGDASLRAAEQLVQAQQDFHAYIRSLAN